jgi:hypothetical protein
MTPTAQSLRTAGSERLWHWVEHLCRPAFVCRTHELSRHTLFSDPPFAKIVIGIHCYVKLRSVSSVQSTKDVYLLHDVQFLFSGLGDLATPVLIFLTLYLLIIFSYPVYIVLFVPLASLFYSIFLLANSLYFEKKNKFWEQLSAYFPFVPLIRTAQKTTRLTILLLHWYSLPR